MVGTVYLETDEGVLRDIFIEQLVLHPKNPRIMPREEVVEGIAQQIREKGFFNKSHALLVRPVNEYYEIVRGHQRHLAAQRAGCREIPCWVREMSDEEAFMELMLGNAQKEFDSLEVGLHVLDYIELGYGRGRGQNGGLREYERQTQKDHSNLSKLRNGAEVYRAIEKSGVMLPHFFEKGFHLNAIHSAPAESWQLLVEALFRAGWSVSETEAVVKRVKELLKVVPSWYESHRPSLISLAIENKATAVRTALELAGKIADELTLATIYRHEETDQIEIRDGREYRLWKPVAVEWNCAAEFRERVNRLVSLPEAKQLREIRDRIHQQIKLYSDNSERWSPVLTDVEFAQERWLREEEARAENRRLYTPVLYTGDVVDGLRRIATGSVDLICTDPPYGKGKAEWDEITDYAAWARPWLEECWRILKESGSLYVFGLFPSHRIIADILDDLGGIWRDTITWDTIQGAGSGLWPSRKEDILYYTKGEEYYEDRDSVRLERHEEHIREYKGVEYRFKTPGNVWRFPVVDDKHPERTGHPTQKPMELIERIIKASCPKGGLVCDPFLGSGTMGVAAMRLRRRCLGVEISSEYVAMAEERFERTEIGVTDADS